MTQHEQQHQHDLVAPQKNDVGLTWHSEPTPLNGANGLDPRDLRLRSLEHNACTDRVMMGQLRAQAELDHDLIEHLQHDLDQARAQVGRLEAALLTARRIGAAVGIVMFSRKMTAEQAFDLLSTVSQHRNRKLRELAEDVLHTGVLDT